MENGVTHASRYRVSGTYQRPQLTLTFTGMVYQGRAVEGAIQGTTIRLRDSGRSTLKGLTTARTSISPCRRCRNRAADDIGEAASQGLRIRRLTEPGVTGLLQPSVLKAHSRGQR